MFCRANKATDEGDGYDCQAPVDRRARVKEKMRPEVEMISKPKSADGFSYFSFIPLYFVFAVLVCSATLDKVKLI
jgi:hypothetical protein